MSRKRERDEASQPGKDVSRPMPKEWKSYFPSPYGDIDVHKYDMTQGKALLQWWYYNAHVRSKQTGDEFSVFSSFFRQASPHYSEEDKAAGIDFEFYDACMWAVSFPGQQKYYADSLLDYRTTELLVSRLDPNQTGKKTQHAETAVLELAKKGRVPLPDRLMKGPAVVAANQLSINLDNECILEKLAPRVNEQMAPQAPKAIYHVKMYNPVKECSADLTFVPQQAAVRHGEFGEVNHMFYYYIPSCTVTGTVTVCGHKHDVEGSGWYDREFGGAENQSGHNALDAWAWFSVQLDDNSQFTVFYIVDRDTHAQKEMIAVLTDNTGTRIPVHDIEMSTSEDWTSLNTYIDYPMLWKLKVPSLQLDLDIRCAFKHQEFMTIVVTGGGFYEGRVHATGTRRGHAVKGVGFLERKNFTMYTDTKGLLKRIGLAVRNTLAQLYPTDASIEWIRKMVLGRHAPPTGVDPKLVCDTLFKPVRALIDRGGKAWRSLILVSAINAISKEYVDCSRYIAISELLHVGSLIIDDIQDNSAVRRGGKCVHLDFGIATAINAGSACYFMAPILCGADELPEKQRIELYKIYFDAMRAGHAGQGLDIAGLDGMMPKVVETGDITDILAALRAIHIFKTGGAAGSVCAMAAIIAEATPAQAKALEDFGTNLGLAFQIVDDALNLRGFEGDLKEVGEDIRDGKITYPVIKAMAKISKADREHIWAVLKEHTEDRKKIHGVIDKLNSVHAIDECLLEARELVESAWIPLDNLVPDSLPKVMMRTFCAYLTERTF